MNKKIFLFSFCLFAAAKGFSQSTIGIEDPQMDLIQRLDIKLHNDSIFRFSTWKPLSRRAVNGRLRQIDSLGRNGQLPQLTETDKADIQRAIELNDPTVPAAKKDFWNAPTHLVNAYSDKASLTIDPLFDYQYGHSNDKSTLFQLTQGFKAYGRLGRKWQYDFAYTYNQERIPAYARDYFTARQGLQGAQTFRIKGDNKDIFEYNDFRGSISFQAGKHISLRAGYDQFFIGEGIRTLYLSDFSAPFYFVQLHAQIGRISYTTVASRTIAPYGSIYNGINDQTAPGNFMVMHYASWQASKWLKVGLFENNTYNMEKNGGIQVGMLNPFIFNRGMSQMVGNSGKSSIGLDAKANIAQKVQLYTQILINEFEINNILSYGNGSWRNKHGLQFGGKYADAFSVRNLDLQLEYNIVRPFTFTDKWVVNNFTHDNLPLAHPLGANFREFIGKVNYRPISKLYLTAMLMVYKKGTDTTSYATATMSSNWGGDLFRGYNDNRGADELGIADSRSIVVKNLYGMLNAAYEVAPRLFVEGRFTYRKYDVATLPTEKTNFFTFGVRWNLAGRSFLF